MNAGATADMRRSRRNPLVHAGWMAAGLAKGRDWGLTCVAHVAAAAHLNRKGASRPVNEFVSSTLKAAPSRQRHNERRDKKVWKNDCIPPATVCGRLELVFNAGAPEDVDNFQSLLRLQLEALAIDTASEDATVPAPQVHAVPTVCEVVAVWPDGSLTQLETEAMADAVTHSPLSACGISTTRADATTAELPNAGLMAQMKNWAPTDPLVGTPNEVTTDDAHCLVEDDVNWTVRGAFKQLTGTAAGAVVTQLNLANVVYFPVKKDKLLRDLPGIDSDPGRGDISYRQAFPHGAASTRLTPTEHCVVDELVFSHMQMDVETPSGKVMTRLMSGNENSGMCPQTMGIGGNVMCLNTSKRADVYEHNEATLMDLRAILIKAGATVRADGSLFLRLKTFRALAYLTMVMVQDGAPRELCLGWIALAAGRNFVYTGADDFGIELTGPDPGPQATLAIAQRKYDTCAEVVTVPREDGQLMIVPVFRNSILRFLPGLWHLRNALARANAKAARPLFREQQVYTTKKGQSAEFVLSLKSNDPSEWIRDSAANRLAYHQDLLRTCPGENPGLAAVVEHQLARAAECPLAQAMASRNKVDALLSALQDHMDGGDLGTVVLLMKELRCVPAVGNSSSYNRTLQWAIAGFETASPIAKRKIDMYDTAKETSAGSNSYTTTDQNFENCQKASKEHHHAATLQDLRNLTVELRDGNWGCCLPLNEAQCESDKEPGPGRTRSTHCHDRDLVTAYRDHCRNVQLTELGAPLRLTLPGGDVKEFDYKAYVLSNGMGMDPTFLDADVVGDEQADRIVDGEILCLPGVPAPSVTLFSAHAPTGDWKAVGGWMVEHCEDGNELFSSYHAKKTGKIICAEPRGSQPTTGTLVAPVDAVRKQLSRLRSTGSTPEAAKMGSTEELKLLDRHAACNLLCDINRVERLAEVGSPPEPQRPAGCNSTDMATREPSSVAALPVRLKSLGGEHRRCHGVALPQSARQHQWDMVSQAKSSKPADLRATVMASAAALSNTALRGTAAKNILQTIDVATAAALGSGPASGARVIGGSVVAVAGSSETIHKKRRIFLPVPTSS